MRVWGSVPSWQATFFCANNDSNSFYLVALPFSGALESSAKGGKMCRRQICFLTIWAEKMFNSMSDIQGHGPTSMQVELGSPWLSSHFQPRCCQECGNTDIPMEGLCKCRWIMPLWKAGWSGHLKVDTSRPSNSSGDLFQGIHWKYEQSSNFPEVYGVIIRIFFFFTKSESPSIFNNMENSATTLWYLYLMEFYEVP